MTKRGQKAPLLIRKGKGMVVKIRKEKDYFLAYFLDFRRILNVNETAAWILDLFFNQEESFEFIATRMSSKYSISLSQAKADLQSFFSGVYNELAMEGFNVINQEQLSAPLGVELEITTSCNLRCKHCFQPDYQNVFMPKEKAFEIIDILSDNNVFTISLIGGEPFRHADLFPILNHCERKGLAVNIVTNATLIDDKNLEKLSKSGCFVMVSFDGIGKMHDYIRGQGIFEKVDGILRKMKQNQISVETLCTLNAFNLPEYRNIVEYCSQLDIPCNFNLFKPFKSSHKSLIVDPKRFFSVIEDLFIMRQKGFKIGLSNAAITADLMGLPPRNECNATQAGLAISVDGKMVTCPSLLSAEFYQDKKMPDFGIDFIEKWKNDSIFVNFRKAGFKECQARSFIFSGNIAGLDPYGITAFQNFKSQKNGLV